MLYESICLDCIFLVMPLFYQSQTSGLFKQKTGIIIKLKNSQTFEWYPK